MPLERYRNRGGGEKRARSGCAEGVGGGKDTVRVGVADEFRREATMRVVVVRAGRRCARATAGVERHPRNAFRALSDRCGAGFGGKNRCLARARGVVALALVGWGGEGSEGSAERSGEH